jgi:hypothetical protein
MDRFVCVRIIQANGMDLSQFQFDYDLTFAAFFMNADKTLYGRFGTRSDKKAMRDISMEGLGQALAAALELHRSYPANKASLLGKKGPPSAIDVPERFPSLKQKYKATLDYTGDVMPSCIHCHQVREAERKILRTAGKPFADDVLYPYPMPDLLGLSLDPTAKARVKRVAPDSPAFADGFRAGDEIVSLAGQPMISIADVQWVLHWAEAPAKIEAEVRRNEKTLSLTLTLAKGWRTKGDISWRTTTWDLRRIALGGLRLDDIPDAERRGSDLTDDGMALRVRHVGQFPPHASAKRAGVRKGDIIVEFDERTGRMSETDLLAHVLAKKKPGDRMSVTLLRRGQRIELELPVR